MIDKGETITLRADFEDSSGNLTTVTTPIEVTILTPDGTKEGPFTATQQQTGRYEYEYQVNQAGIYQYKFTTGDGAIEQDTFVAEDDETS